MSPHHSQKIRFYAALLVSVAASASAGEAPLHVQIDAAAGFATPEFEKVAAEDCGDAAFVRRIYLDLAGRIPTVEQTREFLADSAADKRTRLIGRLLASPEFARRMQYVFDTMLMERRPDKHIKAEEWQDYLRRSFAENKPWDQLAREILTADGSDQKTRPAAKFFLDRELNIDVVTRDVGRIFLGRDLQCAQCHDHPLIEDYLQRHYHGLSAFLHRSYLFADPNTKEASIGEKAEGLVKFTSVFTNESEETPPRLLDRPAIPDPAVAGDPYQSKPEKKQRGVPIYSRRLKLAEEMLDPSNAAFRQNIANRMWAMMMGRGLVEPVDMWHAVNPPSHPVLLKLLADSLHEHAYDLKYLLRELALTKTYQRSSQSRPGANGANEDRFAVALLKPLSPEQLAWSMMQATGLTAQTLENLKAQAQKSKDGPQLDDPVWQEEALHEALKGHVKTFAGIFGVPGVQTSQFNASANQALFLRNSSLLQSWLAPSGQNLTARLKELDGPPLVEEFCLSVFSRRPEAEEVQQITQFLEDNRADRETAIRQLVWAALCSSEFRFNH